MKKEKIINCDVDSCCFNNNKDCKCTLDEIKVSSTSFEHTCNKKETICDSYIDDSKSNKENESK